MIGTGSTFGLLLGEQGVVLASAAGRRHAITIHLPAADQLDLSHASDIGEQLHQAMRQQGVRGGRVVIGLPARWIMARRHQTPPVTGQALSQMLRLTTDRLFAIDARDLVVDFVPPPAQILEPTSGEEDGLRDAPDAPQEVLLLAALRRHIDLAVAIAKAAKLRPIAVTPACGPLALQIAQEHAPPGQPVNLLLTTDGDPTLCRVEHGRIAAIQHISLPISQLDSAGDLVKVAAIERAIALMDGQAQGDAGQGAEAPLVVVGADDALAKALGETLSAKVVIDRDAIPADEAEASGEASADPVDEKLAMALSQCEQPRDLGKSTVVNWLSSRLAPPRPPSLLQKWRGVVAAAAVGFIAIAAPLLLVQQKQAEVDSMALQRESLKQPAADARDLVDQVRYAKRWFSNRPRMLEALRALSLAFPLSGDAWATEMTWRDDMTCVITGKSVDQRQVLELNDRLQQSPLFDNAKVIYIRTSSREQRDFAFAIALQCRSDRITAAPDMAGDDASRTADGLDAVSEAAAADRGRPGAPTKEAAN